MQLFGLDELSQPAWLVSRLDFRRRGPRFVRISVRPPDLGD
jgi:hypothetical protein